MTIVDKGGRDGVGRLATVLAYWAFFSIFPLLLVAVTIVGTLLEGDWKDRILNSALAQFPVIGEDIGKVVSSNEGSLTGLSWSTLIGAVAALWAGTHAFEAYEHAIQVVHLGHAEIRPGFLWRRLRAILLMGILGVGVIGTAVLSGMVGAAGIPGIGKPAGLAISVAANVAVLLVMYELSVPGHQGIRRLLPGAVIGGTGLALLHLVGGWYLGKVVAKAGDTYGIFAAVIGLLTWVNLIGKLVIWSAEVNAVLADRADTADATVGRTEATSPAITGQVVDGE